MTRLTVKRKIVLFGLALLIGAGMSSLGYAKFRVDYPQPNVPEMKPCIHETAPQLPKRWQAIALMLPYRYKENGESNLSTSAELQVGRFVYDHDAQLMRATRYGVKNQGAIDLLLRCGKVAFLSEI